MATFELTVASGQRDLYVRQFAIREAVSSLFTADVMFRSPDTSLELGAIVGHPASFRVVAGYAHVKNGAARVIKGIVSHAEQVEALQESTGLSTYTLQIVPAMWLLTQRQNNRIFQHLSIPDIVTKLLGEWGIQPTWKIDAGAYPKLEYKVQYAESDYHFLSRLLEEAGIAFTFAEGSGDPVFSDKLQANAPREGKAIPFVSEPNRSAETEYVTEVQFGREVKPGAAIYRDYDYRKPTVALFAEAPKTKGIEGKLEQYHYDAGAFFAETGNAEHTPSADDQGFSRHDPKYGQALAARTLEADRTGERTVQFVANTFDLTPGAVFSMDKHPHAAISNRTQLLVTSSKLVGTEKGDFDFYAEALFADAPYRPAKQTHKPVVHGLQSAMIVGPAGQEIHTDEFGRVRVQFPWDREGKNSERSSCWMRVNQGWGGQGFGMVTVPRIGQEVLVSFLDGDPDFPMVVGRVFNAAQQVPHALPNHKTRSSWKTNSTPGSDGYNEIMFEDLHGQELVWQHAQRNRDRNVNNDEFLTIMHDRQKLVKRDEDERTDNDRKLLVGKDVDVITKKNKNETHFRDVHELVKGSRREKIDGNQSLSILKSQHEKVEGSSALRAGDEIHVVAGDEWIGEAASEAAIKGPGGFISLGAGGVVISGTMVWINERGDAPKGKGAKPEEPFEKREEEKTEQSSESSSEEAEGEDYDAFGDDDW